MKIDDDMHELLNQERPGLIAVIGTHAADGFPQLVPVWYRWDGEQIIVWTLESRAWVQNVLRDNRVGVSIAEQDQGSRAIMMRGYASVETSDESYVDDEIRAISRRYVDDTQVESYIKDWGNLRTIVKIRPRKHFVWR